MNKLFPPVLSSTVVEEMMDMGTGVQGYLAHKKHPPVGPFSSPMPLGPYGDPMGVGVAFERGTPVHVQGYLAHKKLGFCKRSPCFLNLSRTARKRTLCF